MGMEKSDYYEAAGMTPEEARRICTEHGIGLYWHTFEDGWHGMDPAPIGKGDWVPDHIVARLLLKIDELNKILTERKWIAGENEGFGR